MKRFESLIKSNSVYISIQKVCLQRRKKVKLNLKEILLNLCHFEINIKLRDVVYFMQIYSKNRFALSAIYTSTIPSGSVQTQLIHDQAKSHLWFKRIFGE